MSGSVRFLPAVGLLCLILAGLAALTVWPGFDGLYGQDSFSYLDYALGPLDAALRGGEPLPAFFWPPGYPLLVWSASILVGASPLAGQVVALLGGALVPVFTALLAWELFGTGTAGGGSGERSLRWLPLLVGVVVAVEAQLWQSSVVVMSDTPSLAAGTAGVWLVARWGRTGRMRDLLGAAVLLAFAVLTRWAYGLVAIPVGIYTLVRLWRTTRDPLQSAFSSSSRSGFDDAEGSLERGRPLLQAVLAALVVGVILLPIWLPAGLDLVRGERSGGAAFAGSLTVYRWSPINALRRTFTTTDGQLSYGLPNGLYYALAPAHWYFFTPLLAPFLIPGAWSLWRRRSARRLWLIVGWAGVVMGFHAGAAWQNFRFTVAYLPPLAVVLGLGILTTRGWLMERVGRVRRRGAMVAFAGWVGLGLCTMAWGGVELTRFFIERKRADLATVDWVEEQTPPNARLLAFDMTFTLDRYGSREVSHLFYETPETIADLPAIGRPIFILIEPDSFLAQWGDHPSGEAFRWLREERGLVELGRDREYVLYRVGGGT